MLYNILVMEFVKGESVAEGAFLKRIKLVKSVFR